MNTKQEKWLNALKDVTRVLDNYKCNYFLDNGTLLGAIREGKFIEWDNDMDLGVLNFSFDKMVMKKMAKSLYQKGYNVFAKETVLHVWDNDGDINLSVKFYYKGNHCYYGTLTKVAGSHFFATLSNWTSDKSYYVRNHGNKAVASLVKMFLMNIGYLLPTKIKRYFAKKANIESVRIEIPEELVEKLSLRDFYGIPFMMPKYAEKYLSYRYGNDWNIPKRNYSYMQEDGAIKK